MKKDDSKSPAEGVAEFLKASGHSNAAIKLYATGVRLGAWEIANGLYKKRALASKWVLAGSIAFIFAIVSNVNSFFENYGKLTVKVTAVLFFISSWYGLKSLIGAYVGEAFARSESLGSTLKRSLERQRNSDLNSQEVEEGLVDPGEFIKQTTEQIIENTLTLIKASKSLFWQSLFFILGIVVIFISFLTR
jgi:hypothetical protein